MKKYILLLLLIASSVVLRAQDFPFGQYQLEELDMKRYAKDTNAHAVVLREFGKTWMNSSENGTLVEHEYHVKIKLFDAEAFNDYGNVAIPIYKIDNNTFEEVSRIEVINHYQDADGNIKSVTLDQSQIFHIKENRYWDLVKFAIPGLRKGCIIEYKYLLESPRTFNFHTWHFQDYIPKIYSEYEVHIPAYYDYNVALRGYPNKLSNMKQVVEHDCFTPRGAPICDCSKMNYIMADIPAFIPEDYMTSPKNYMAAVYFELSEYLNPYTGSKIRITKDWKDIDYDLKHDEEFGVQLKKTDLMRDRTKSVIAGITDSLDKAKAIYRYVQKNYKWDGIISWGSDDGIRKALNNHTGSVADINLTLIAALNSAGINTEAVLLSTRDHGLINKLYPVQSDFNYVVAKANVGGKSYLLDATDPFLPFGLLPLACINDQGRVMSLDKPSYWIDMTASQKQAKTYALDLTLGTDGKLKGTINSYSYGYEAYNKRRAIKKFNSIDEYVEDLDNRDTRMKILKSEISNVDSMDNPLMEKYEVEINAYNNLNNDRFNFSPFIVDRISKNPFKLNERVYPVDRGAPSDAKFMLTVHLPPNYKIETLPQNVGLVMPAQGGRFILSYAPTDDGFTCSYLSQFNKSIYSQDEYPYLKELMNKIIQAESAEIVFRKN